jgi:glucose-1-phosphate cytidylyltransferase
LKVVILAGGKGTRLSEEGVGRPKPMVEVGGRPILSHVMSLYASWGHRDFIVALGYKAQVVKEHFLHRRLSPADSGWKRDWKVQLIDTGVETQTGGRLLRLAPSLRSSGTFMLTYADGLGDIDLEGLLAFHRRHGRLATVTAVRPPERQRLLSFEGDAVTGCETKGEWISGGFFVFEPSVLDYLSGDDAVLERQPLARLAAEGELMAYRHEGFWQCMDTAADRKVLEDLWQSGRAPWTRDSAEPALRSSSTAVMELEEARL